MMAALFLGIRLQEKPYERLKLTDINFEAKKIGDLKEEAEKLLNFSSKQLEFIYCGTVLRNDASLAEQGIKEGGTIHVFQKQEEEVIVQEPITEAQIHRACISYRAILKDMSGNSLAKAIRSEVIKKVLDAYPEFHYNLGAFAILKDAILIGRMSSFDTAKEIAKQYPILITSAEFVTQTMREHLALTKKDLSQNTVPSEDSLSDTSSSEGDAPMSAPNQGGDIRQISRDQLIAALMQAGSASRNSLSNIAQRNNATSPNPLSAPSLASASNSARPTTSTASTSAAGGQSNPISSSFFGTALSQVLSQVQAQNDAANTASPQAQAVPAAPEGNLATRYATELVLMQEMGLFDEEVNIQALIVSSGNVEAAINLVLGGFGST